MKKQKKNRIDKFDIFLIVYWILAGLGTNLFIIHRDGSVGIIEAIFLMLMGGLMAPICLIAAFCFWANQLKIGF